MQRCSRWVCHRERPQATVFFGMTILFTTQSACAMASLLSRDQFSDRRGCPPTLRWLTCHSVSGPRTDRENEIWRLLTMLPLLSWVLNERIMPRIHVHVVDRKANLSHFVVVRASGSRTRTFVQWRILGSERTANKFWRADEKKRNIKKERKKRNERKMQKKNCPGANMIATTTVVTFQAAHTVKCRARQGWLYCYCFIITATAQLPSCVSLVYWSPKIGRPHSILGLRYFMWIWGNIGRSEPKETERERNGWRRPSRLYTSRAHSGFAGVEMLLRAFHHNGA